MFQVGDIVIHRTLGGTTGEGTILSKRPGNHYMVKWHSGFGICIDPEYALAPAYQELPYDPTQQGDKEEDI